MWVYGPLERLYRSVTNHRQSQRTPRQIHGQGPRANISMSDFLITDLKSHLHPVFFRRNTSIHISVADVFASEHATYRHQPFLQRCTHTHACNRRPEEMCSPPPEQCCDRLFSAGTYHTPTPPTCVCLCVYVCVCACLCVEEGWCVCGERERERNNPYYDVEGYRTVIVESACSK